MDKTTGGRYFEVGEVKQQLSVGANDVTWPFTFAAVPTVVATLETSSSAAVGIGVQGVSTTGATINVDTSGTFHIIACYVP